MLFITCTRTTLALALSISSHRASPAPTVAAQRPDSVCAATQVTGIVTDSSGHGVPGLWVQDGYSKGGSPDGPRVQTDAQGHFLLMADHSHTTLWVFADTTNTTQSGDDIGQYDKKRLVVKDCVAAPITIGKHHVIR